MEAEIVRTVAPGPQAETMPQGPAHVADLLGSISNAFSTIDVEVVAAVARILGDALRAQRTILLLGNGGSCATASHLATDLAMLAREASLKASVVSLNDNPYLVTATANDYGFAESGAALVEAMASAHDVLVIFSCSGRSPNLVSAAHAAAGRGVTTILVGSSLAPIDFPARHGILVNSRHYSVIESVHVALAHALSDLLRARFAVESSRCARELLRGDA